MIPESCPNHSTETEIRLVVFYYSQTLPPLQFFTVRSSTIPSSSASFFSDPSTFPPNEPRLSTEPLKPQGQGESASSPASCCHYLPLVEMSTGSFGHPVISWPPSSIHLLPMGTVAILAPGLQPSAAFSPATALDDFHSIPWIQTNPGSWELEVSVITTPLSCPLQPHTLDQWAPPALHFQSTASQPSLPPDLCSCAWLASGSQELQSADSSDPPPKSCLSQTRLSSPTTSLSTFSPVTLTFWNSLHKNTTLA